MRFILVVHAMILAGTAAQGQLRFNPQDVISESDSIFPALSACKASLAKSWGNNYHFSSWVKVDSSATARVFPKLRFAAICWGTYPNPEALLPVGFYETVAVDRSGRVTALNNFDGRYGPYGKFLVDSKVRLRDADDAKVIWEAFCDIHHCYWKDYALKKISISEWHLGVTSFDRTMSVMDGFKTQQIENYYMKVFVDPTTGLIESWDHKVDISNRRRVKTE